MLCGDEESLRLQALHELLTAAEIEKDDFDLATYSADETLPVDWLAAAGTSPFLATRRTVIVRHLLRRDVEDLKKARLKDLPDFALVILVADDEAGDENKQSKLKTLRKNWQKAVTAAGGAVFEFEPDPKAVKESIRAEVAKMGKTMTETAAAALMEMTAGSLSRALDELKKIELYVGSQSQIREADVREVVVPSREWNVYKMVESTFQGQMPEALRQLRVLMGSATKAEEAAFQRILPTVSRQLRLLWQARACVEGNFGSPAFLPASAPRMFPERHSLTKEQSYRLAPLMVTAKGLNFAQIERCFAIVADTDARLKGSLSSFSALDTLERMLLEMASVVTPSKR